MIRPHTAKDGTKTYGVRINRGEGKREWVGSFPTKKLAREAEAQALLARKRPDRLTVNVLASRWLAVNERTWKPSSYTRATDALSAFRDEFGPRLIGSITRAEAEEFAGRNGWRVKEIGTMFNYAIRHEYIARSVFAGLTPQSKGRVDQEPLTDEQLNVLLKATHKHKHYAPTLRGLIGFGAYSGLRPGELFALEWRDIDFEHKRLTVRRGVYRGVVATPKSGEPRPVFLLPQAAEFLRAIPRTSSLVFPNKRGGHLSNATMAGHYLPPVRKEAGRHFTLHELRHFHAHYLYVRKDLPARVVAKQLGHSTPQLVERLYGHWKVGAMDDLARAFEENVVPLRATQGAHGAF